MKREKLRERIIMREAKRDFNLAATNRGGQDRKVDPKLLITIARDDLRVAMLHQLAYAANNIFSLNRAFARKAIGLESAPMEPEVDETIRIIKRALDGDPDAVDYCSRDILENCEFDGNLKEAASRLEKVRAVCVVINHSRSLASENKPSEGEILESLINFDSCMALALKSEIQQIARYSPYQSVRTLASKVLKDI